ncbi:MAG: SDR family oxidoreductase [Gammaproteobacteria bacterium]|nr:SDR family oxidoreductase [Gammaproteobacteria bacterium]
MSLNNRIALVTGAARGIGLATAEKLAASGATVIMNDLDAEPLNAAAERIPQAQPIPGDLTAPEFPDQLIATALEQHGRLDILVNNAGYVWNSAAHNHSDEQWQAMLDMHATAPFRLLRAYGRWLRQTGPEESARKVVNVSSVSGLFGAATQLGYSAGKAAVIGITRTLAKEWGRFNVTVNAVAFGHIETRLTQPYSDAPPTIDVDGRDYRVGLSEAQIAQQRTMIPLGRPGTPQDAANALYLFCAPESDYISGEILVCSGGLRI